jgi:hypothetical protein
MDFAGNLHPALQSGAEYGAPAASEQRFPLDLAEVIEVWKTLPASLKAGILAMIRAV